MQINRDDSDSGLQSEINITPLVDVVLVLLIIFMVVVPLSCRATTSTYLEPPPSPWPRRPQNRG